MITLDKDEHIILSARRHPFFLFLELLPLLPLILIPLILIILAQFVDISAFLAQSTERTIETVNTIAPVAAPVPDIQGGIADGLIETGGNARALAVLITTVWLLLVWIAGFMIWTDYYLDVLILTNKKIVDIEQQGLFAREVSSLPLGKIQDVTVGTQGILATFFHFGNLKIQTAGASPEIIVRYLRDPSGVKEEIMRAYHSHNTRARD